MRVQHALGIARWCPRYRSAPPDPRPASSTGCEPRRAASTSSQKTAHRRRPPGRRIDLAQLRQIGPQAPSPCPGCPRPSPPPARRCRPAGRPAHPAPNSVNSGSTTAPSLYAAIWVTSTSGHCASSTATRSPRPTPRARSDAPARPEARFSCHRSRPLAHAAVLAICGDRHPVRVRRRPAVAAALGDVETCPASASENRARIACQSPIRRRTRRSMPLSSRRRSVPAARSAAPPAAASPPATPGCRRRGPPRRDQLHLHRCSPVGDRHNRPGLRSLTSGVLIQNPGSRRITQRGHRACPAARRRPWPGPVRGGRCGAFRWRRGVELLDRARSRRVAAVSARHRSGLRISAAGRRPGTSTAASAPVSVRRGVRCSAASNPVPTPEHPARPRTNISNQHSHDAQRYGRFRRRVQRLPHLAATLCAAYCRPP